MNYGKIKVILFSFGAFFSLNCFAFDGLMDAPPDPYLVADVIVDFVPKKDMKLNKLKAMFPIIVAESGTACFHSNYLKYPLS